MLNEEAKDYEPELDDIFFVISSGEYQRLIFCGQDLREREETHMTGFKNYLIENSLTIPDGYDDENRLVLRFL